MFLAVAMCVTATVEFRKTFATEDTEQVGKHQGSLKPSLKWWLIAGLLGGAAVLIRPDSGLFMAAIGLTPVLPGPQGTTLVGRLAAGKAPTKTEKNPPNT